MDLGSNLQPLCAEIGELGLIARSEQSGSKSNTGSRLVNDFILKLCEHKEKIGMGKGQKRSTHMGELGGFLHGIVEPWCKILHLENNSTF